MACAGGIPTIAVSISHDLLHWTLVNTSWVVPDAKHQEMWVEAGSPPQQLQDGNYIMSESRIADPPTTVNDQPRRQRAVLPLPEPLDCAQATTSPTAICGGALAT